MRVIVTVGCALPRVGWLHASPEMIADDATTRKSRSPIPIGDDALWNTGEASWMRVGLMIWSCSAPWPPNQAITIASQYAVMLGNAQRIGALSLKHKIPVGA